MELSLKSPIRRLIRPQEGKCVSDGKSVGESLECPREMKDIVKRQEKMGGWIIE